MPTPHVMTAKGNATVVSEVCRLSYPALAAAKKIQNDPNSEAKFGGSFIFAPADTTNLWDAIVAVANANFPPVTLADGTTANGEVMLRRGMIHTPLRSGAERPTDAAYANTYFINAGAKTQPNMIGPDGQTVLQASAFYGGCWVRCFFGVFAFKKGVNNGIGIGLNAIQFVRDGERLDGRADPRMAFAAAGALTADQIGQMPGTGYSGQPNGGYAAPAAQPSFQPPQGPVVGTPIGQPAPQQGFYPQAAPQGPAPSFQPPVQQTRAPALPPGH